MSALAALRAAFDPDQFKALGHKLVDRLAGYLSAATGGARMPVLPRMDPGRAAAAWPPRFLPGPAARLDELVARMIAGSSHLHHPRYVGHQVAPVLPAAALSSLVTAFLNNSMAVHEMGPSGAAIEGSVVRWMTETVGWGDAAGGVLTSGGALGNLTALLAARECRAPGGAGSGATRLAVLASEQAHYSVARATRVMGWGPHGMVPVPVDEQFRLRASALEDSLAAATRAGLTVIGVVANACSTATGTFDPLDEISDFCAARGLWLHVDAAHGAPALLSNTYRPLLAGIDRADSVIWDAHKMMLMPLLATGVLFRDRTTGERAVGARRTSYLYDETAETAAAEHSVRSLECSKPALGFPLYAALSLYGTEPFADYLTATFDLARRFGRMIAERRDFELALEPEANIVCFRYVGAAGAADTVQMRARQRLLADGAFYLAQVRLPTGLFLRATVINPFTGELDLADLLDAVRRAAGEE